MSGYIYLIKLREFNNIKEPIYKIGRSSDIHRRSKEYPNNSILLYSCIVNNEIKLEKLILEQFNIDFILKKEYGTEYFKGDYIKMIEVINDIINKYDDIVIQPDINIIEAYNNTKILFNEVSLLTHQKDLIIKNYVIHIESDSSEINERTKEFKESLILLDKEIDIITTDIKQLLGISTNPENVNENIVYSCDFDGYCELCKEASKTKMFCTNKCNICNIFRDEEKKMINKNTRRYYNEYIPKIENYYPIIPESNIIKPKIKSNNVTNINVNINNININNVTVNTKEYIKTKDSIFNVIITSFHEKAEEKLRYVFTCLMCGANGKRLFPGEPKYSKSVTYPVSAATYNITYENNCYTLYGVLRYKYQKKNSMSIKKLENMGDQHVSVKAISPEIWQDHRYHLSIHDVDDIIMNTLDFKKGSNPQEFYIED